MNRKNILVLFFIFLGVLIVKLLIVPFIGGPYVYPDESCAFLRALFYFYNGEFESCTTMTGVVSGDPFPLYSILIYPVFYFYKAINAYYAILVLNTFIVSLLVFPLYGIFKRFLKSDYVVYFSVILTVFLPQIFLFEKMMMTEMLFFVFNIWFLYFYLKSFDGKGAGINKVVAFLFAVFGLFTRPFGFITLIAFGVNEFILSKKKKYFFYLLIGLIAVCVLAIYYLVPGFYESYAGRFFSFFNPSNWLLILDAMKNQVNSYVLAAFFVPLIVFFSYVGKKDSDELKHVKWFLLIYILLNFLVSAQHIYGYFLELKNTNLLTRYINSSLIYILIFSIIFMFRYKKFEFNKSNVVLTALFVLCLVFLEKEGKHAQNIDLSLYFKDERDIGGFITFRWFDELPFLFLAVVSGPFYLLVKNYRKAFIWVMSGMIIIYSVFSMLWLVKFSYTSPLTEYFIDNTGNDVLFVVPKSDPVIPDVWKILVLGDNNFSHYVLKDEKEILGLGEPFDYIVSKFDYNAEVVLTQEEYKVYKLK
jgi:hypothetical protein